MAFLNSTQLDTLGLKSYGTNVLISDKASLYNPELISIGNNVRIDDFCILSGDITLKNYIHISAYAAIYGKGGVVMEDYTGLSPRCTIFSASDDFSGEYMISPMVPMEFCNVHSEKVYIEKYSQVGAHSIIMPGVILGEGSAIGAQSFVKNSTSPWFLYAGIPAKKIKSRSKNLVNYMT